MKVSSISSDFTDDDLDLMFGSREFSDYTNDEDYQMDMQAHCYQYS